eukprot:870378-Alexandrium_andersonii.AAC.1
MDPTPHPTRCDQCGQSVLVAKLECCTTALMFSKPDTPAKPNPRESRGPTPRMEHPPDSHTCPHRSI